jgi:hypothetical protein
MKKLFSIFFVQAVIIITMHAQNVSDYSYKLDNGITVRMENCWNQVWVQQTFEAMKAGDKTTPLSVSIRTLGDLMASSTFKLVSGGKEIKMQSAGPGTYDLRLTYKLSGKPGTLSFVVNNVVIKPQTKTTVTITLYDYQILIEEKPSAMNALSLIGTQITRCKRIMTQDSYQGIPALYVKGKHDTPVAPAEQTGKTAFKIKPGTYDLLISMAVSGQAQKVWLENFAVKPDVEYKVTVNLNAGGISYAGGNKAVKTMLLYPAGTSSKQTGNPAPVKGIKALSCDNAANINCCPPGAYDVLLDYGTGSKFEWKKNLVVTTGAKTDVK